MVAPNTVSGKIKMVAPNTVSGKIKMVAPNSFSGGISKKHLDKLMTESTKNTTEILFICMGNICRCYAGFGKKERTGKRNPL